MRAKICGICWNIFTRICGRYANIYSIYYKNMRHIRRRRSVRYVLGHSFWLYLQAYKYKYNLQFYEANCTHGVRNGPHGSPKWTMRFEMAHTEVQSGPRGSKWPTQKSKVDHEVRNGPHRSPKWTRRKQQLMTGIRSAQETDFNLTTVGSFSCGYVSFSQMSRQKFIYSSALSCKH